MPTLNIKGVSIDVRAPYAEGHALNANEAGVLNQTFLENIRNNVAAKIKSEVDRQEKAAPGTTPTFDQDFLKSLSDYVTSYEFGVRAARTSAEPIDPVEREAHKMARSAVMDALREQGVKKADLPEGRFDTLVAGVAKKEEILKEAKRRVGSMGKLALDLGDVNATQVAA